MEPGGPPNSQMMPVGPGHMNAPPGPPHMNSSGPHMGGMAPNAPPNQPGVNQMNQSAGPPAIPGQENLNALQKAIDSMEEKGLQEDPRYSQLLALRARQGNMGDKQTFSSQQLQQLRLVVCLIFFFGFLVDRFYLFLNVWF